MTENAQVVEDPAPVEDVADPQVAIDAANGNAPAASESADPDESQWSDFANDIEEDDLSHDLPEEINEVVATPEPAVAPPAEEVVPPVVPTEEVPPVTPTAEVAPVAAPEVTPPPATPTSETPPQTPAAPETPAEPVLTPEEHKAKQAENRANVVAEMAKKYSLPDEEAELYLTDPAAIVPKQRAELFMDVFDAVMQAVQSSVPQIVERNTAQNKAQEACENAFYSANPQLSKAQHQEVVNRYAQNYINMNPEADAETFNRDVGIQVMFSLGINPTVPAPVQAPAAVQATPPHTPAGAGSQSTITAPSASATDVWGGISEDLAEED